MTPKERAAMQQALEALREYRDTQMIQAPRKAIDALREALVEPTEQEPVARVTGYYGGRCVVEPLNRATVLPTNMALYAAPVQQAEQEPIRFVWNGEGWIEADEYIWKTTDDHERRILYTTPQPDMNLNCKSVQKRLATSWCYVKAEQAAQEPYAYEVWDANDQVLILIYASCLKEFYWIEQDDIARKLYAAPVRTKDLTDDELRQVLDRNCGDGLMAIARAAIAADREKNK